MRLDSQIIKTSDGIDLFVRCYSPDELVFQNTLYWVHGLGEHGGRHEHIAKALTQQGWRMIVADLRGHGKSRGKRTYVKSFDDFVSDISLIWQRLQLDRHPTVLFGHSMGGLVVIRTVQSQQIRPRALILSAPLLGLKLTVNPLTVLLGKLLVRFFPAARFSNGIDPANMTHDPEFASIRRADPLINKTVTAGWFFAMKDALKVANRDASRIQLPTLAFQGTLDQTTDADALSAWWQRIGSQDKTRIDLEGHFHELFFEPDWRSTADQMIEWLNERMRLQPSEQNHAGT